MSDTDTETQTENRRQFERVRVTAPVKLEATLKGRFIDILSLELTGVTVDMSRGGVLAKVDQSITPGVRCRIEIEPKDGKGEPRSFYGRVRRSFQGNRSGYLVALEFDEPLKVKEALAGLPGGEQLVEADDEESGKSEKDAGSEKSGKKGSPKKDD